ncbi:hypothetical protein CROQUDRAFT_43971 [Cronartium quercuum f. sp. fusiforme G11]|uniref:Uncharacterized protein n=1 Tax=Cronartium quercuum f. sp. fusiforme G11 TaxID=708437 RepID=A0A9P6NJF4_9BASI|nr:hypothetical protein CROQUDRAFT_43971 [Cronartium quercuum f. sp. fusiforme G11]
MDFNFFLSQPDGAAVDLKTVLKHVHGLAVYVRGSPQHRERFAKVVELYQPEIFDKGITCLILDVETRWTSTYAMFQHALILWYEILFQFPC